jgi:dTDP-glucose 4,6-dehydratase
MIIKGLAGEPLPVYGDGSHIRDWLFVDDHAQALTRILQDGVPGETYNIGGNNEYPNLTVVKMICDLLDRFSPMAGTRRQDTITFVADRPGHDKRYAIDAGKIERELGWVPRETFPAGLEKTVKWYLENRSWWQPILDRGYKTGRLGIGAVAAE